MKYKKKGGDVLQIGDNVLVFDIETDGLDTTTAKMKWFGAFSFWDNEYYLFSGDELESIQRLIDAHRVVVGFNSNDFDIPICENNGLNFDYKIRVDLLKTLFKYETRKSVREQLIKVDGKVLKELLPNHKLKTIAEVLKLSVQKGEIDYNIFKQDVYTKLQIKEILKYLYYDVKITKELFEYMYKEFLPMKQFMKPKDQNNYNWFRTSLGSYTYKVICHHAGIEEEYGEHSGRKKYEGGFVSQPAKSTYSGKIYCLDFKSAYPHAFMMGNLYAHGCKCCSDEEKWNGNEMFPVEGKYCTKAPGKIEKVIKKFYNLRMQYKKNKDPREYTVKLIINTMYGISGSSVFTNLYSLTTASDCTLIVREMVKYARRYFSAAGYDVIYTDTDSVYLRDNKDNEKELLYYRDVIIKQIKKNLPFPEDTFDMGVDARIKGIWFFKDEDGEFKKKNYIYLTESDKIEIKGLPLIKSSCSRISQNVYESLKPLIIERGNIKFSREYIEEHVYRLIKQDMGLIANYYKVKHPDQYKSQTSIQCQISVAYGEGEHWLVPNLKLGGAGKSKKYCSLEEAKELCMNDLYLDHIWDTELSPFIRDWQHPKFIRRQQKAKDAYERQQDKIMQTFFKSDLWDSEAVGSDITDEEFLANEMDEVFQ